MSQAKNTGLTQPQLKKLGFVKKGGTIKAILPLNTIWAICKVHKIWRDEDGFIDSQVVRFLGKVPVVIKEVTEAAVYDLDPLYYPPDPDEVYEAYARCFYINKQEDGAEPSDSTKGQDTGNYGNFNNYSTPNDVHLDKAPGAGRVHKAVRRKPRPTTKKVSPKKRAVVPSRRAPAKKSPKPVAKRPVAKRKPSPTPKKRPTVSKRRAPGKKLYCKHPDSSFGDFIGDRTCITCKHKTVCSQAGN